ncbi:phosphatidylethanolamine N-methyltransferase isoform X6 [Dendrobates tinctorius]|uniref:phosphatidylethanolamine N-methyltransferase isoform X6 n=1 Tax=Dendrobates tinctorius TaxID=92724 RepID=UPI003CCA33B8
MGVPHTSAVQGVWIPIRCMLHLGGSYNIFSLLQESLLHRSYFQPAALVVSEEARILLPWSGAGGVRRRARYHQLPGAGICWNLSRATLHVLRYDASGYQALVFLTGALSTSFPGSSDYRGDYFGILMEEKVTGFPFNIMENPMYWGSTANYLGLALMNSSPSGLILTAVVAVCYKVAILFEGPFTEQIYRRKAKTKKYR